MAVEVVHGLAAVRFAVDDKPCTLFGAAVTRGKFLGLEKQPSQKGRVGGVQFHYVFDVLFGNHQKMYRRLGVYVIKGKQFIILIQLFGGDFSLNDFAEDTITHGARLAQFLELTEGG